MKNRWFVLILLFSGVISSCTKNDFTSANNSNLYVPAASDTTSIATLDELTQGRKLYISNCNECHQLYSPNVNSASEWSRILPQMAPRTNMTPSEIELVSKYLRKGK